MPSPADIQSIVQDDLLNTRAQLFHGLDQNPDEAARATDLEQSTGVPAPVIASDQEGFERNYKAALAERLVMGNPQLRAYIHSHPMAAAVSNDDWGNLDSVSTASSRLGNVFNALNEPLQQPIPQYTSEDIARMYPALDPKKGLLPRISNAFATGEANLGSILVGGMSNIFSATVGGITAATTETAKTLGIPGAEQLGRDIGGMAEYEMIKPEGKGLHPAPVPVEPEQLAGKTWMSVGAEPPPGIHPQFDAAKANINQLVVEQLQKDLTEAQASSTFQRSPEMFQKFVEQHYGDRTISISGDAAVANEGLLDWVPGIADKLDLARSTGADVEIPIADLFAKADPKVIKALGEDIRAWPGGITAREAALGIEPKAMVQDALPQVRGAAGLEPAYGWGDRKLTLVGNEVLNDAGKPVGTLDVVPNPETKQLTVQFAGEPDSSTFGPGAVNDLMKQLSTQYPGYESITGVSSPEIGKAPVAPLVGAVTKEGYEAAKRVMGGNLGAAWADRPSVMTELDNIKANAMGLDAKTYARLKDMIDERYERDVDASLKRAEREQTRRQTKEWKANRAQLRGEVEGVIRQRPDVATDLFLGSGEIDGKKVRQRFTLAEDALTPDQKLALPDHYYSKNGLPPDEVAKIFGYGSGDAMIDRLALYHASKGEKTPQEMFRSIVDAETDHLMEARYGHLTENILNEAKDQALSENNLNILAEEMYAAGVKAGTPVIDKVVAKEWAKEQIGSMSIGQVSSDKLMALMGKHGRDSDRALINGDPATAMQSMQRKFLSALMAAKARKVEKGMDQFDRLAKTLSKRNPYESVKGTSTVDPEYVNFGQQILMQIGKPVRRSVQDLQEQIAKGSAPNLKDFVEMKTGALREMPVWPTLFDEAWKKPYKSLTVDEFNAVHGSVKTLIHNGRDEMKIEKAGEAVDFDTVKGQMKEALQQFPRIDYTIKGDRAGEVLPKARHLLRTFGTMHMQVETLLNRWDKFDPMGVWNQYVMRDLIDGSYQEDAWRKEYAKKLIDAGDKLDLKKAVDNPIFHQPMSDGSQGPLFHMTRAELRAVMLNVGSSISAKSGRIDPRSNLAKLASGYNLEPEDVMNWVHQHATAEDWAFVRKIWDIHEEIKGRADTMYRSLTGGVPPESLRFDPIQTPHGEVNGGYYPIIYHDTFEGTSKKLMGKDTLEQNNYVRAGTPAGYTKSRTVYSAPLALDLDRLPNRIAQELHDVALRPAVINVSKVFTDPAIRATIRERYGKETQDMLLPYLQDVANSSNYKSEAQSEMKGWSEFIRQNMVTTLVGLNQGTIMKHGPTAWVQSLTEVGPVNFLKATKGLLSINEQTGEHNWTFAMSHSLMLQRRVQNYMETLTGATAQLVPGSKAASLRQTIIKIASYPVAMSDLMSAVPTWMARYEQAISEGSPHGDAVYLADRAVRRAHGDTSITNRPAVMRDVSPWFTSVYTFFNHIMNRQAELIWNAGTMLGHVKEGEMKAAMAKVPAVSAQLFAYVLFPALVEEMVSPLASSDNESWGKKAAKGIAFTLGGSWVGVREIAHALLRGDDPAVGLYSTAFKTVTDLGRDFGKKQPFNREHAGRIIQDAATLGGLATGGMPEQVGKAARFGYGVHAGIEHPKGPWGWLVGARFGTLKHHSSTFQNFMQGKGY